MKAQLDRRDNLKPPKTFEERVQHLATREFKIGVQLSHEQKGLSNTPQARVVSEAYDQPRLDGNTVDIDREIMKEIENTFFHNAYIELLNRKHRILKTAINGGRS